MHEYSLSVAIFDFFPVLVTAIALVILARGIAARRRDLAILAFAAAVLIPLGGLAKAAWKLLMALDQAPGDWLQNLLFILLAPGFVAMAFALFHARRAWQAAPEAAGHWSPKRLVLWLTLPWAGAALAWLGAPQSRLWFFWLLGLTTLANMALIVQAVLAARWCGLRWPVTACFLYNFAATLALSGLSRLPPGEMTAWIQEGVNLSAQAALALGAWQLSHRMTEDN